MYFSSFYSFKLFLDCVRERIFDIEYSGIYIIVKLRIRKFFKVLVWV